MSQEQTESWETTVYDTVYSCYSKKKKTMFIGELTIASITKQISIKEPTVKLPICQKYVLTFIQVSELLLLFLTYRFIWKNGENIHMNKDLQKSPL